MVFWVPLWRETLDLVKLEALRSRKAEWLAGMWSSSETARLYLGQS